MKYWWLEKYKNFKIIQINDLYKDVHYFITMPKNYEKQYKIVTTKNIKNNHLNIIIEKLLEIPDNSFPSSDYSLIEMLDEIKNLKTNLPYREKLDTNNIAICYHCLNIFYVDKIKSVNKNNLCLCPFCLKSKLYFDNDYIPMNYTFIKLAYIYYHTSNLGCSFKNIQKIIKNGISTLDGNYTDNYLDISKYYSNIKIKPIEEKIINRKLMLDLYKYEANIIEEGNIYIPSLNNKIEEELLLIILVTIIEVLANTIYLKKIRFIFKNKKNKNKFDNMIKTIKTFK